MRKSDRQPDLLNSILMVLDSYSKLLLARSAGKANSLFNTDTYITNFWKGVWKYMPISKSFKLLKFCEKIHIRSFKQQPYWFACKWWDGERQGFSNFDTTENVARFKIPLDLTILLFEHDFKSTSIYFLQEMEGIFWFVLVTEEWFTKWTIRIWPEADMASHHLITQLPVPVPIIKISSKSLVLKATKNMLLVQIGRLVTIVGLALRRDLTVKFEFLLCLVNDMKKKT